VHGSRTRRGPQIQDLDSRQGKLFVQGKGAKRRTVCLGNVARKAVWRYLATREDRDDPDAPLFANFLGRPISRQWLRRLLTELGEKAGVPHVHPHRFRYTFAI
jgi:integrase/recombinase XerD